jgi:hypothetical protein
MQVLTPWRLGKARERSPNGRAILRGPDTVYGPATQHSKRLAMLSVHQGNVQTPFRPDGNDVAMLSVPGEGGTRS